MDTFSGLLSALKAAVEHILHIHDDESNIIPEKKLCEKLWTALKKVKIPKYIPGVYSEIIENFLRHRGKSGKIVGKQTSQKIFFPSSI